MMINEEHAGIYRCCGPTGCGERADPDPDAVDDVREPGRRYCIGSDCMAWQERERYFITPSGEMSSKSDLAGTWPEIRLGCCGLAPDHGGGEE